PWPTLRDTRRNDGSVQKLYTIGTALGNCRTDTVGHLLPCDSRHAPVQLYRSYGEWFEAGLKVPKSDAQMMTMSSRFWPYGQGVTKVFQTADKRHTYNLDDHKVKNARPYVPAMSTSGSLPDLRSYREGGSRHSELMDSQYHNSFRNSGKPCL
ncbi:unnamed protein product, partial [Polarella glacialis]